MRREIVMGGCYLGMAGHDVFNNRVREIVNTNEHRVVLLALDISNFKYINDFYGMDEGDKVMQDIADFYFIVRKISSGVSACLCWIIFL